MPIPPAYAAAETRLNAALATLLAAARTKQDAFLAARGRYWQGLWTHLGVPVETAAVAPDNITAAPTDAYELTVEPDGVDAQGNPKTKVVRVDFPKWGALAVLPGTMTYRIRIDTYDGPAGKGWVGTVEVVLPDGTTYTRAANTGPETWRAFGWRVKA